MAALTGYWSAVNVNGQTMFQSGTTSVAPPVTFGTHANLTITSGATLSGLTGSSMIVTVQSGGTLAGNNLTGGTLGVANGGVLSGNILNGVGTTLSSGAQSIGDTFQAVGTGIIWSYALRGATVTDATVDTKGYLQLQSGATGSNITAINGGSASLAADTTTGFQALNGGYVASGNMTFSGYSGNGDVVPTGAVLNGIWSAVNVNGTTVYQNATTTVSGPVILNAGASLYVKSGANVSGLTCISNAIVTVSVYAGGSVTSSHITRAYVRVDNGASLSHNQLDGCDVTLSTGASSTDDTYSWYNFAVQSVKVASGATISSATVNNNTTVSAATGANVNGLQVFSGGSAVFASGVNLSGFHADAGTYLATYTSIGGTVTIPTTPPSQPGTVLTHVWSAVLSNGVTVFKNALSSVSAPVSLTAGTVLYITSGAVVSGLNSLANTIYVQNGGTLLDSYIANGLVNVSSGGITNGNKFNSDFVTVMSGGSSVNDIFYNSGYTSDTSTIQAGGTMINGQVGSGATVSAGIGSVVQDPSVGTGGYLIVNKAANDVCFVKGTRILTDRGEVPVEDIRVGDAIACQGENGVEFRPAIWVGSRFNRLEPWQPLDLAGYPVRIEAGAFGDGLPTRDLFVTPEHCFAFEGRMLPIRMLVNGTTIAYDTSIRSYEYFHIELADHAIIFAEGAATESYIDTGNRRSFTQNGNLTSLSRSEGTPDTPRYALPLDVSRDFAEPLYRRLAGGACLEQDNRDDLTQDPDLMLIDIHGHRFRPVRREATRVVFMLPQGSEHVRLVSRASRPCDTIGPFVDDRRRLGVLVGRIDQFSSLKHREITGHLTTETLRGWHAIEAEACRWMDGDCILPLHLDSAAAGAVVSIEILAAGPYLVESRMEERAISVA